MSALVFEPWSKVTSISKRREVHYHLIFFGGGCGVGVLQYQTKNPPLIEGNSSHGLPKIVDKYNSFKGQQRKEHNLQMNRWMIPNWANMKEKKKCEERRMKS